MPLKFDGKTGEFSSCVAHFVKKGKSKEAASGICGAIQKRQEGSKAHINKFCIESNVEYKAIEVAGKKEHHVSGFVSAPYVDSAGDFVPESLQLGIVERINKGFANRVSLNHDFLLEGNLLPIASARSELKKHPKLGIDSAWVDIVLDETSPKFNDIIENIEGIKGFSIEYTTDPAHHYEEIGGKTAKVFDETPVFGLALVTSPYQPVNQMATADGGYEYKAFLNLEENKGDLKMEKEKVEVKTEESKETVAENAPKVEEPAGTEAAKVEEKKEEPKSEEPAPIASEAKASIDFEKLGKEVHAIKLKEKADAELKAAIQIELKETRFKQPYLNPAGKFGAQESSPFDAELKSWRDTVKDDKADITAKYNAAGRLHDALSNFGINERGSMTSRSREWKKVTIGGPNSNEFVIKGGEYKAQLEHDTNKGSDTDYLQNAAELNDIYDPVIIDHLNNRTTYYGLLRKKDVSQIGSDRYGFKIRTARIVGAGGSTTAYEYDEGATLTGQSATKLKVQAPFMQYGVVLQVSGFMQAMSRGSIGDAFAKEVQLGTADLLKGMNTDLLGTAVGFTAGGKITGLQVFGDDGGTYANLYGHARSTFTTLQGALRAQTGSPNVTKVLLRQVLRDVEIDGADRNQSIFVMHPIQRDKTLGLLDAAQRFNNTSARAGFEGMPMFDGVPIHSDVDALNTVIHVVPMDSTYLSVLTPPTFEDLAKTDDSKKGFVKTFFAHVMENPNHGGIITGLSNS